jgi:hypothetical protein
MTSSEANPYIARETTWFSERIVCEYYLHTIQKLFYAHTIGSSTVGGYSPTRQGFWLVAVVNYQVTFSAYVVGLFLRHAKNKSRDTILL